MSSRCSGTRLIEDVKMEGPAAYGINANLLFGWRRRHLQAQASQAGTGSQAAVLLPVSIEAPVRAMPLDAPAAVPRPSTGSIEIEIGNARVRLRGAIDEASLRTVLSALRSVP